MNEAVRLGILSFAHVHAPSYARQIKAIESSHLVGVSDRKEYRGKTAASRFDTKFFSEPEGLLEEVDGVVVCSENSLHKELTVLALQAGKTVLCEKPIAPNLQEADEMIEAAKEYEVELFLALPMRFSPPVNSLKNHLLGGKIGDILAASSTNHGKVPPGWFQDPQLAGGGAVMDHTPHVIDLFGWVMEKEIGEVFARAGTLFDDRKVEDSGLLSVNFRDGSFASLDTSWSRPKSFGTWGDVKMRVYGKEGVINLDAFKQEFRSYVDERGRADFTYWGTNPDREMIKEFAGVVGGQKQASRLATGEDGKKCLQVALAAYRSNRDEEVVKI